MGVNWKYLDLDSKNALLGRMVAVSPLGPHSASMAFTGLSKMGASWGSLPADARKSLEDSFPMPSQASEQVVANMIHSYGSMGALYARDLSAETKDRLTASFVSVAPAFTVQGLSNTLHGLSKMGYRMENWPDALLRSFESALFGNKPSSIRHMKDQGVSNTVWSLGQCGAQWTAANTKTDAPDEAQRGAIRCRLSNEMCLQLSRSIASNAPQMTEQGLSNTLLGLAKVFCPNLAVSCLLLSCLILLYIILSCLILLRRTLSCFILLFFNLILYYLIPHWLFLSILSHSILPCTIISSPVFNYRIQHYLALSHIDPSTYYGPSAAHHLT
jgi:hypothetical protein